MELSYKFPKFRNRIWVMLLVFFLFFTRVDSLAIDSFWNAVKTISAIGLILIVFSKRKLTCDDYEMKLSWGLNLWMFKEFSCQVTDIHSFEIVQDDNKNYQIKTLLINGDTRMLFTHPNKNPTIQKLEEIKAFLNYEN